MLEHCTFEEFDKIAISKGWRKISNADSRKSGYFNTPVYRKKDETIHLEGNLLKVYLIEITDNEDLNTLRTLTLIEFKKEK